MLNHDDSSVPDGPTTVAEAPDAEIPDVLVAALAEIERHVGAEGWDQPARVFALVRTDELMRAEPALADQLADAAPDSLSAIEHDDVFTGDAAAPAVAQVVAALEDVEWSPGVAGVALVLQRGFLPAGVEVNLPEDADAAAAVVDAHPARQDMRVVVGVLRDGTAHGLARLRERPDELRGGAQLAPALTEVLLRTLQ